MFLSTYDKKIDKKGRVLVPPSFRAALASETFNGVVVYHSFVNHCIEACGMSRVEELNQRIAALDPFSAVHDAFADTILSGSTELGLDKEGRIVLPEELLKEVSISQEVTFVGKGDKFEIWEPSRYKKHASESRALALAKRDMLRAGGQTGGAE